MQNQKACVVIPTYNERENIGFLLERLEKAFVGASGYTVDIVVADDKSPDGTGDIVSEVARKYENIRLLPGEREGMGAAYVRAFSHILDSYDVIITMDADFSHPPEMIPDFLRSIDTGCDMVIGSRYIGGGGTPDWPLKRRLISSFANLLARTVAGLYSVHDCTSNYRAYRASILRKIPFHQLSNKGYAFVTTCLWEVFHQKGRVCEIPLVFYDRKKGETKLGHSDITEFLLNCFRLRLKLVK
ncbi:MAG: polyprenol monophosphomannose synthase [Theionarchaea archaeon]|nr:polyprenol monophosphomannose synthase [Theionarchaea archaeon]